MKEKRNVIEWTVSILTAFTGTWALQWVLHLDGEGLGYTNSIISVFVFLFLGWLSKKIMAYGFEGKWYDWIWPVLFGSIFAFCMVAGTQLDTKGRISGYHYNRGVDSGTDCNKLCNFYRVQTSWRGWGNSSHAWCLSAVGFCDIFYFPFS